MTREQFEYYAKKQGSNCFLCGQPLSLSSASRDHWIPKSKFPKGTHHHGNIRMVCKLCNQLKADIDPETLFTQIRKIFFRQCEQQLQEAA